MASEVTGQTTVGGEDEYASPRAYGGTTGPRDLARALKFRRNGPLAVRSTEADWAPQLPDRSGEGVTLGTP